MGIWKYCDNFNIIVDQKYRLSLSEGNTPLETYERINEILNCKVYFKREDKNPNGSHKDRSIAFQVSKFYQDNIKDLTISSSGNSAISASAYCSLADIRLTVFISPNTQKEKLERLGKVINNNIKIVYSKKAKSDCFKFSKENGIPNLTPSKDRNSALEGMKTLGIELSDQTKNLNIDSIFMPASSATGFLGIAKGYESTNTPLPSMNLVQTGFIHPLAGKYDGDFKGENSSLAKAIVSKILPLDKDVFDVIDKTNGSGWVIENDRLKKIHNILLENGIKTSYDSALSPAGLQKAMEKGGIYKNVVCVLTGI